MQRYHILLKLSLFWLLIITGCSDSEGKSKSALQDSYLDQSTEKEQNDEVDTKKVWKISGVNVGMGFSKISHLIPDNAIVQEEIFDGVNYHFYFDGLQWTFYEDGILDFILIDGIGLGLDNGMKIGDEATSIIDLLGEPTMKESDFYSYDFDGYELQFYTQENEVESIRMILRDHDNKGSQLDQELLVSYIENYTNGRMDGNESFVNKEIGESLEIKESTELTEANSNSERSIGNLKFKIYNLKYVLAESQFEDILSIEVEIENIGSSTQVVNSGWFDLYNDEGFTLKQTNNSFTSVTLQPGKKATGNINYIVKTETPSFELFYSYVSDLGKDMTVTWHISKEDIN